MVAIVTFIIPPSYYEPKPMPGSQPGEISFDFEEKKVEGGDDGATPKRWVARLRVLPRQTELTDVTIRIGLEGGTIVAPVGLFDPPGDPKPMASGTRDGEGWRFTQPKIAKGTDTLFDLEFSFGPAGGGHLTFELAATPFVQSVTGRVWVTDTMFEGIADCPPDELPRADGKGPGGKGTDGKGPGDDDEEELEAGA